MEQSVGNVQFNVKPTEQALAFTKDRVRKFWPKAVFVTKPGSVTEHFAYFNDKMFKSWEQNGETESNMDKMFIINVLHDSYLIVIPAHHSKTEKEIWTLKSEIEKRFPNFS